VDKTRRQGGQVHKNKRTKKSPTQKKSKKLVRDKKKTYFWAKYPEP
jgi:hypothetical protein